MDTYRPHTVHLTEHITIELPQHVTIIIVQHAGINMSIDNYNILGETYTKWILEEASAETQRSYCPNYNTRHVTAMILTAKYYKEDNPNDSITIKKTNADGPPPEEIWLPYYI